MANESDELFHERINGSPAAVRVGGEVAPLDGRTDVVDPRSSVVRPTHAVGGVSTRTTAIIWA